MTKNDKQDDLDVASEAADTASGDAGSADENGGQAVENAPTGNGDSAGNGAKTGNGAYRRELEKLQVELVKLLESVKRKGQKVCVLFEGRDAAGKGGTSRRISQHLNPRMNLCVALDEDSI